MNPASTLNNWKKKEQVKTNQKKLNNYDHSRSQETNRGWQTTFFVCMYVLLGIFY